MKYYAKPFSDIMPFGISPFSLTTNISYTCYLIGQLSLYRNKLACSQKIVCRQREQAMRSPHWSQWRSCSWYICSRYCARDGNESSHTEAVGGEDDIDKLLCYCPDSLFRSTNSPEDPRIQTHIVRNKHMLLGPQVITTKALRSHTDRPIAIRRRHGWCDAVCCCGLRSDSKPHVY